MPGILHGLTVREFFSELGPVSVGREIKLPDNRRGERGRQNIYSHLCTYSTHCTSTVTHRANTRGSRAHSPGLRIVVSLKQLVIPASCLIRCRTCHRTLLHDLSHLPQPSSGPSSPSLSCLSELDQETLRDSRRSGGKNKSASPTLIAKVFGKLGEQFEKSSQDRVAAWLGILSQSGQDDFSSRPDFSVSEPPWDQQTPSMGVGHAGAASTGPRSATRSSLQFGSNSLPSSSTGPKNPINDAVKTSKLGVHCRSMVHFLKPRFNTGMKDCGLQLCCEMLIFCSSICLSSTLP